MSAKKKSSNRSLKIIIFSLIGLIVVLIGLKAAGVIGKEDGTEVEVAEVSKKDIVDKVLASGIIQPVTEVKLSPDVSGEIIELNVLEGDSVRKGQVLLKIRPDIYESALDRALANLNQQKANVLTSEATLSKAKAQYERAKYDFERNRQLFDEKVISESEFQLAEANYKVALNDVKSAEQNVEASKYILASAKANLKEARQRVGFTTMHSPVDGIVSKLNIELGERVVGTEMMSGTEIMRIADLSKVEARVDVNENDIIRVSIGDSAIIDVDAYAFSDRKFKGIVTSIANSANDKISSDAVTEFEVKIRVLNESFKDLLENSNMVSPFRPGMTASVDIVTDVKEDVIAVPIAAVTTRKKGDFKKSDDEKDSVEIKSANISSTNDDEMLEVVFVKDGGKAKMVEVKTSTNDFENIQILEGLEEGQEIITGPFVAVSKILNDGKSVVVKKDKDKKD